MFPQIQPVRVHLLLLLTWLLMTLSLRNPDRNVNKYLELVISVASTEQDVMMHSLVKAVLPKA